MQKTNTSSQRTWLIILVASLGYFVDIYDLVIFSIVRIPSFTDIGIAQETMRKSGEYVLNMQMGGLLLGGILWGIIGDKFGRVKVLFGSILMYSLANIANGFVTNVEMYAWIRFIAGIGLAGELGAGITLVSENMNRNKRGYGTMLIASIGVLGAVAAFYVSEHYNWRNAYFAGGIMGIFLLFLRLGTFESNLYKSGDTKNIKKGDFLMIIGNKKRLLKYLNCILIGLPIWFVVGVFITQAPEFGKALNATETLSAGKGILFTYLGISLGDIIAGLLAQIIKSRLKTVFIFQILIFASSCYYLSSNGITQHQFMWLAFFMGLAIGYWATFATIAAEQFGTNLRATVSITVPNFVRGALIPSTFLFEFFVHKFNIIIAGFITITLFTIIAVIALSRLKETFNKDLNYWEEN